jgi:predicted transcriptional regulator
MILNYLFVNGRDTLTNMARALDMDRRRAYDALKRLIRRCFVEKDEKKRYSLTELGLKMLAKVRVVNLSKNSKKGDNMRSQGKRNDTIPDGGCGGVGYVGRFFDNVRGYVGGVFVQSSRGALLTSLAGFDVVSYFEVAHVVKGFSMEGVVVIYTNDDDPGLFGGCVVRVEWRPPEGVVKGNPPASVLRLSRFEFVKAFKAFSLVLKELLLPEDLADLYAWLGRRWRLMGGEKRPR